MRHKVKRISLGKDRKHRIALLRNLAQSFIRHERIKTTKTKARIFRSYIEKLITRAKVDSLHNRRMIFKDVKNTHLLKKLFENIAKRYQNRPGGYTRTYKLIPRIGDASEMCIIELVPEFLESSESSNSKANDALAKKSDTTSVAAKSEKVTESSVEKTSEKPSEKSSTSTDTEEPSTQTTEKTIAN